MTERRPGTEWRWDETLFAGTAAHYLTGRMPYSPELVDALREELGLDGTGRLLDVGCGPGSLTLLLAPLFAEAIGVDPDPDMLTEASRRPGAANVRWHRARAEDLPAGLGVFRVVTFAQSFHWMDQPLVAARVRDHMLEPGGFWVHVGGTTHQGAATAGQPPWDSVDELVTRYLGPVRRAGQGHLPNGTRSGEEDVMRAAGFRGPTRLTLGGGRPVARTIDDVVASVFSTSGAAPHLFADRLPAFEADLRGLLASAAAGGRFTELTHDIEAVIWRLH
ncbi:class I SAM-dependent methyltransferase [Actinoplanes aureus]|uniref:Class I SAM-dependent methyltransferase n=1 Tax=Actinoplanes aureus TaxID=2792083 RepID=A0A931FYY2_9ACTN|nr:class I SAM-dependent methyltransferase [Actinoplanes aureus]MBG0562396.1 class I SAM-dependent methyltransferase [Actinoplanes aureus]